MICLGSSSQNSQVTHTHPSSASAYMYIHLRPLLSSLQQGHSTQSSTTISPPWDFYTLHVQCPHFPQPCGSLTNDHVTAFDHRPQCISLILPFRSPSPSEPISSVCCNFTTCTIKKLGTGRALLCIHVLPAYLHRFLPLLTCQSQPAQTPSPMSRPSV